MSTAAAPAHISEIDPEISLDPGGEEAPYIPPDPTDDELKAAKAVFDNLKKRVRDMGDERIIDALLQIVDILPQFKTTEHWLAEDSEEYAPAQVVENMGKFLCECRKIGIGHSRVIYLFRNKDKWMDGDKPRRGQTTKLDTRQQYLNDGKALVLEVNFHHWLTLNPLQKVQTLYRLLRERDEEASGVRPDFVGFMDEVELFGLRTFHELVALEHSLRVASEVRHPHQLAFPEWE